MPSPKINLLSGLNLNQDHITEFNELYDSNEDIGNHPLIKVTSSLSNSILPID
ncbi:MAG: hypothetical protein WD512_16790 [Candidatus Paceibacterota bacterium]